MVSVLQTKYRVLLQLDGPADFLSLIIIFSFPIGSGMIVLLELARMFSRLYKSTKTQPSVNLVFLLSAGGKFNYFGTKKWLESQLDSSSSSELLSDVKFCLCIDAIGNVPFMSKSTEQKENKENTDSVLNMHVSKPPKDESHSGRFFASLENLSQIMKKDLEKLEGNKGLSVRFVHKKINLADERLAWEHERFSIRRLPAFTLSNIEAHDTLDRIPTILDRTVDVDLLGKYSYRI